MNRDSYKKNKSLERFLKLIDEGRDVEEYLADFPEDREKLKVYSSAINGLKNLKNIRIGKGSEDHGLEEIYSKAGIQKLENRKKISKRDALIIRLQPSYLKPLTIFLGVFVFISFSFAGTIYASSDSLPGDALYTVKRTSENMQIAFTPYKFENTIYLKMLDKRLSEADIILSQADYRGPEIAEKLIYDIDETYKKCRERHYVDSNRDWNLQMRIESVKDCYKNKCGMKGTGNSNCNTQYYENLNSQTYGETMDTGTCIDKAKALNGYVEENKNDDSSPSFKEGSGFNKSPGTGTSGNGDKMQQDENNFQFGKTRGQ